MERCAAEIDSDDMDALAPEIHSLRKNTPAGRRSRLPRVIDVMAYVMITCPAENVPVHTGQHALAGAFENAEFPGASFRCAACRGIHPWTKSDAWLAAPQGRVQNRVETPI